MSDSPGPQPADHDAPEHDTSGVDLARAALHQAREAARARGETGTRKTKTRRRPRPSDSRRGGREPMGFAALVQGLMAERAWDVPFAGGSVLDRWPAIADAVSPTLPAHVVAVAFHEDSRQLDLRPDSPAYATQLRLLSTQIVTAANDAIGMQAVRTVRVLAAGPAGPKPAESPSPAPSRAPEAPVKTREMASPGFHQALAAHQAAAHPRRVDPSITEAAERQTQAMRALSQRAFPDPQPAPIGQARTERRRQADDVHTAALRRARAERAAKEPGAAAGMRQSPELRTTA